MRFAELPKWGVRLPVQISLWALALWILGLVINTWL